MNSELRTIFFNLGHAHNERNWDAVERGLDQLGTYVIADVARSTQAADERTIEDLYEKLHTAAAYISALEASLETSEAAAHAYQREMGDWQDLAEKRLRLLKSAQIGLALGKGTR